MPSLIGSNRQSYTLQDDIDYQKRHHDHDQQPEQQSNTIDPSNELPAATIESETENLDIGKSRLLLKGANGEHYFTRYQIDHTEQSNDLCHLMLLDECVPCCDIDQRRSLLGCVWSCVRSEVFIYVLHFTSLFLGAFKEAVGLRQLDAPVLTVVDSSFETLATLLVIAVRMGNAYFGYCEVRNSISHDENNEIDDNMNVRLIRRWMLLFNADQMKEEFMTLFNAGGVLLFGSALGFFLLLLFEYHLGWTILTNNFCLLNIQTLFRLYKARVTLAVSRIHEDQHKVVISESVLLIRDMRSSDDRNDCRSLQRAFISGIDNCKLFVKPPYITLFSPSTKDTPIAPDDANGVLELRADSAENSRKSAVCMLV